MTSISSYGARARPPNPLAADPEWIHRRFERAVDIIQSLPKSGPIQTNYDDKLLLYAVYKQATEGNIKTSRPGMFDVLGRAKWDAWNKRKGLSPPDAERMYVEALIRILRGYSDRTQAVELMRELENFTLNRIGGSKLAAPSRTTQTRSSSSSGTSSSRSTGSYDDDDRRLPQSSSRSRSNLTPQADRTRRHQHRNRVQPPPADLVAPSLPGYGPPRTRTDSVRRDIPEERVRGSSRHGAAVAREEEEDSDDYSSDEDGATGPYASVPPTAPSSVVQRLAPPPPGQQQQQFASTTRLTPNAPPSISRPHYPPAASLRSLAHGGNNSPAPSVYSLHPHAGGHHQQIAYPPGFIAPAPVPLTSTNLLQRTSSTVTTPVNAPIVAASQQGATPTIPALDAALDRIQTSLTALHERLSILESSPNSANPLSRSSSSSNHAISTLFKESLLQFLILCRIRSSPSTTNNQGQQRQGTVRLRSLLPSLLVALLKRARKLAGDFVVFGVVVVLLGKLRGVDVTGMIGNWVVRYLIGRQQRGNGTRRVQGGAAMIAE
ncbi:hypothetical protein JCM16303_006534 [Sporobolomyces ruberrimus]